MILETMEWVVLIPAAALLWWMICRALAWCGGMFVTAMIMIIRGGR